MNKGTTRHPKYFCDKCGLEIRYTQRKGFIGLYTYAKREKNSMEWVYHTNLVSC